MMLVHIGQGDVAEKVHNAWLATMEEGVHTGDIYHEKVSELRVGTNAFADAVIERLGRQPTKFTPVAYAGGPPIAVAGRITATHPARKELVGVDVFLHWRGTASALGDQLARVNGDGMTLSMISNRGVKVWPNGLPETFCTDHWRCRFLATDTGHPLQLAQVLSLLMRIGNAHYDFVKTEHLYTFDGVSGFSLGQGQ
jgi:isocitrate dehydrogenase